MVSVLISGLWAILPLLGWGAYDVKPFGTSCTLQWSTPDKAYIPCVFAGCLLLPIGVMSASYGSILRNTSAAGRRLRKHHLGDVQHKYRRAKQELRLIKIIILMSVCFLLAWLPYAIVALISAYTPQVPVSGPVSIMPTLLAKTSHITNPIIYFSLNSRLSRHLPYCTIPVPRPCVIVSSSYQDPSQSKDRDVQLEILQGPRQTVPNGGQPDATEKDFQECRGLLTVEGQREEEGRSQICHYLSEGKSEVCEIILNPEVVLMSV
ncbi:hypothetical protein ACOMHN_023215 [Nucella lapillus]